MRFSISFVPIFGLRNYPHFLLLLILQILQHYHFVGIFLLYPTIPHVEAGMGENFTKTTLTWDSASNAKQYDGQLAINASVLSCTDDNWNGNCEVIGTHAQVCLVWFNDSRN